jgi:hypothetical protein
MQNIRGSDLPRHAQTNIGTREDASCSPTKSFIVKYNVKSVSLVVWLFWVHPNPLNVTLCNVNPSLISQNPREHMHSIYISLLVVIVPSHIPQFWHYNNPSKFSNHTLTHIILWPLSLLHCGLCVVPQCHTLYWFSIWCIHVKIVNLLDIKCIMVATCMMLGRLERTRVSGPWSYFGTK